MKTLLEKLREALPTRSEVWRWPALVWLVSAGAAYAIKSIAPSPQIVPPPFNNIGPAIFVLGGLLIFVAGYQFMRMRTNIHPFRDPEKLITSGIFAFTRNPIYLGFILMLIGLALYWNALGALAPAVVFFLIANFYYAPGEEADAQRVFGEAYETYRRRVRRWL
ncbi:MAG: isoprenylcysteine carboxylmethyltransferase family protein [Neomegalonema sp.]|nr:isoprenylcysteine carboxylmethyltransferase family protein [Neomegalonema sp.]